MKKRTMSILLVLTMVLSLLPMQVFAAENCLKITSSTAKAGDTITVTYTVPKKVENLASVSAKIKFDSAAVQAVSVSFATLGTITAVGSAADEANNAGEIGVSWVDVNAAMTVDANTNLLSADFIIKDTATGTSTFVVDEIAFSDAGGSELDSSITGTDINSASVRIVTAISGSLPISITAPVKGATPETNITDTKYTGTIAWTPSVSGIYAADTAYTAKVTLTAKTGYQFASDVNPTVPGATNVTENTVSADGSKLEFKAAFPKTADKDTPTVTAVPAAGAITYGQTLNDSALTGGTASVAGTFKWKNTAIAPQVSDSGTTEYEVIFTPNDTANYTEATCKVKLTVTPKAITDVSVDNIAAQTYTGSQIKPTVTVKGDNGKTLALNKDYTVEYGTNENVGTGTVTVKAKDGGNYTFANVTKDFQINKATVPAGVETELKAAVTFYNAKYDGAAHDAVTVSTLPTGWTLAGYSADGTSYSDTVPQLKNVVDSKTVYVKLTNSNYSDYVVSGKAAVTAKALADSMINLGTQATYNGTEQGVAISSVMDGTTSLISTKDYAVKSGNKATNVEETSLKIKGIGNYTGEASVKWSLEKATPKAEDFNIPALTEQTYDGNSKAVNVTTKTGINGMGNITVKYNGNAAAPINAGSYTVTFDVADGQNYTAASDLSIGTLKIDQATLTGTDKEVSIRYTDAAVKTFSPKDFGFTQPGALEVTTTSSNSVLAADYPKADNGNVQVKLADGLTAEKVNSKATIELTFTPSDATNYKTATVKLTITVSDKATQARLELTGGTTVVYGQTLALGTTGGSGDGEVTYAVTEGTGKATISGNVLTATQAGTVTVKATKAATDEYSAVESAPVTITITKAKPGGTPGYTAITAEGKTLEDAALGIGTIAPAGNITWVDADGAELAETTPVEANKNYAWKFVPTDTTNYEELTGSIQLWHKSTGGKYYYSSSSDSGKATASAVLTAKDAKSATDYTSGIYGLTFRSTADFSGFKGIKVDGKTVDKKNYIAENNGGIEVYLKAAYLKTLADGRHTLTIMATGGNASTDFTIGGVNTAPKTFDTGIAMYVTMAVASVTGMAWLGKKKEN